METYLKLVSEKKEKIQESVKLNSNDEIIYCEELLSLATQHEDTLNMGYAYIWMADYYFYNVFDIENTSRSLELGYTYILKNKDYELLIKYYRLKGLVYESFGDYINKVKCYLSIFSILKESGINDYYTICYGNIGITFQYAHDYEEALKYSRLSEKYFDKYEDRYQNIQYLVLQNNICENLFYLNDLKGIKKCLKEMNKMEDSVNLKKAFIALATLRYNCLLKDEGKVKDSIREIYDSKIFDHPSITIKVEFVRTMFKCALVAESQILCKELFEQLDNLIPREKQTSDIDIQKYIVDYNLKYTNENENQIYKEFFHSFEEIKKVQNKNVIGAINNYQSILEIRNKQKEIEKESELLKNEVNIDSLTSIYNRRYLNELKTLIHENENMTIGIAIIDIDYFKEYNDTYGHLKGDEALIEIANIMKENSSKGIVPCRYGGDEFFVVFINKSKKAIELYLNSVAQTLKDMSIEHQSSNCSDQLTLSIGYDVRKATKDLNYTTIFENADKAVYASKRCGRNQITQYSGRRKDK